MAANDAPRSCGFGEDEPYKVQFLGIAPFPVRRDLFEAMDDVARRAELYKLRALQDGTLRPEDAAWLADRVLNVIQTIKNANVTYGLIGEGGLSVTPMMVERDAIVGALDAR